MTKRGCYSFIIGFISLLLIINSAGCQAGPAPATAVEPTATSIQAMNTRALSANVLPTNTKQQIPTLLPTGTPFRYFTSTPEKPAVQVCLTIEDYTPDQISMEGHLLLYDTETYTEFSYDFKRDGYRSAPFIPTPGRHLSVDSMNFAVSPNGKWIASLESTLDDAGQTTGRYLAVADVNGKKLDLPAWSFVNNQQLVGWINDEQIALTIPNKPFGATVALNPFNDKVDFIPPPDAPMADFGLSYSEDVLYDPTLTHVLFVKKTASGEDLKYGLMDLSIHRIIREDVFLYSRAPKWAPDGRSFAILSPTPGINQYARTANQFFQVTLDGKAFPLTPSQPTDYSEPWSWSPDSRFIAAWLVPANYPRQDHFESRSLNLIDVANRSSIDFCLESENIDWTAGPIWSPNSQYIAIPILENPYEYNSFYRTILVDIKNSKAFKFMDNVVPVGWMAEP